MLNAVHVDADRDVSGLVAHVRPVTNLHDQGVQEDDRVERIQRSLLPSQDLVQNLVGDRRDRLSTNLGADRGDQVMFDIADRHPAGIQRHDHVIEPT